MLELVRLEKRVRKTEDDLEDISGKGYKVSRLTFCDGWKSKWMEKNMMTLSPWEGQSHRSNDER